MSNSLLGRRTFFRGAIVAGVVGASGLQPRSLRAATDGDDSIPLTIVCRDNENVVETQYGKVRGSERNGIRVFRGIPYAADTGGNNRFVPAKPPTPWSGVRSALWYENVCFQGPRNWSNDENAYMFQWDDGQGSEDCMRVNVWTPRINDQKKRPVMVWVHGGGYFSGSGQELRAYDGEKLAAKGDVVVVTFNHRLNTFGFLNIAEFGGPDYVNSGNAGMMDCVFLLEWVRDNIANFGGDPENVTIMGQSGGGQKVGVLLTMPSAVGLFHKASIHSSAVYEFMLDDASRRCGEITMAELGLTKDNWDKILSVPTAQLYQANASAMRKANVGVPSYSPGAGPFDPRRVANTPYLDGIIIPRTPFDLISPGASANVPVMVGNVLNEFTTAIGRPDAFQMTSDELSSRLAPTYGQHAQQLIDVFRKNHANANPFQLFSIIQAARGMRQAAVHQATSRSAHSSAPTYLWWFQWQTPILDGRPMAFHCSDLSFFFNNMERCATMTGTGAEAQKLYAEMSGAWIAFARTGNPNHGELSKWEPATPSGDETMIFDSPSRYSNDPDSDERGELQLALRG